MFTNLKNLLIVKQILLVSTLENAYKEQYEEYTFWGQGIKG